jgi:superfamily II DNA or RNA helicase
LGLLNDQTWKLKYTPDDGDLVRLFYLPALESAVHYDRSTGYFSASALALAARGIEGLIRNSGRMRLIVGCTLNPPEIQAIERGEKLRDAVERHLATVPLSPPDQKSSDALELLAWMTAAGILEIKVAVPCDEKRRPMSADGIFHEKAGIVDDKAGNRLAFNGSINETEAGWRRNWESFNVFTSWGAEPARVEMEEANFGRIWANQAKRVITLDVPNAIKDDLLRFLPTDDRPARLRELDTPEKPTRSSEPAAATAKSSVPSVDIRRLVWGFIRYAPALLNGGERVGEATAAVVPWPHQVRAFQRLYDQERPKLLIADEVGLGKTVEAGLLLRQSWLSGRAKRILVLAPKAVLRQWQIELREKFNLNWPIYDGQRLVWYSSPAKRGHDVRPVDRQSWHKEPVVIASSHLMRRRNRSPELLEQAEPWDLIILDEAHHARRRAAGSATEGGPNALLQLMHGLRRRTEGMVLLTATPMQVHPTEVWDLLNLLGLPPEWTAPAFLRFFDAIEHPSPSPDTLDWLSEMFRAVERRYGQVSIDEAIRLGAGSRLKARKILGALRDQASIPRRQLETPERRLAIKIMRTHTPIARLVSRHTRELLRRYFKAGKLSTPIADRRVEDRFIDMSSMERALYAAVEDYIATTYNQASEKERSAVGFVMTIYRRRLASSFRALGKTLEAHLAAVTQGERQQTLMATDEDVPDDEAGDEVIDADELTAIEREALALEERSDIESLLNEIRRLPPDTKVERLKVLIGELRDAGYEQAMVFTQYTDTMDFVREELGRIPGARLMCFSGRGGEVRDVDGSWRVISRDDAKRRFRDGQADLLLCTDAAAEGLNFQFCGALVNYDMPWNPMRVEQRIGRIDRLGQKYANIRIVNLHYADTIEADVYAALRQRIGLFENVVGRLQPILARLPGTISSTVLTGASQDAGRRAGVVSEIEKEANEAEAHGFDIDAVTEVDLSEPVRPPPLYDHSDLNRVINSPSAMPPGISVTPMGAREYAYLAPGMAQPIRVTTDPDYYEEHAESVELWSPGSPLFPSPDVVAAVDELPKGKRLPDLLQ